MLGEDDLIAAPWDNPDMADADKLRDILEALELSQREAARLLEVQEGTFRGWCSGKGKVPNVVWLALEALQVRKAQQ